MLEKIIELINEYIESMLKKKKIWTVFTSVETVRFISELYNFDEKTRSA